MKTPAAVPALVALTLVAASPVVVTANPGDLDPSFGTGGKVTTAFGKAYAVALQGDGKIVAAGRTPTDPTDPFSAAIFALARYNPDGNLDATFGTGGKVTTAVWTESQANAVAVQGDGKIVAAGAYSATDVSSFALARYNSDGSLDSTFGTGGTVTTTIGTINSWASALVLQPDGKIVAAGGAVVNAGAFTQVAFALARYNPDGNLDATFGTGGITTTGGAAVFGIEIDASAVALQGDGKIVVAGYVAPPGGFELARYNPDGNLDATFGTGGKVTDGYTDGDARAVALQGDGKIVVAGPYIAGFRHIALARFNADGSLDATFGTGGEVTTGRDQAHALALQGDGKIVAAGSIPGTDQSAFALTRYNTDGSLDATFGTGGEVTTAFDMGIYNTAYAVALQGDGKIVAAGSIEGTDRQSAFALARYLNDTTATTITTTTTRPPTTTPTSATTLTPPTTTTTTLPCTTARCTLAAALMSPACAGQTIPASVTGKLGTAETLINQAATTPGKKGRKVLQKAKNLLKQAGAKAARSAKGKHAKLSAACAITLGHAANSVRGGLGS